MDTDTFFTFCTFWLINDIRHTCQRYKFYIWHTTDIHLHMHRNTYVLNHQNTKTYNYYFKSTFMPKLARIITLNRKFKEILPCQINSETPTLICDGVHDNILEDPLLPTNLHLVVNCQMSSGPHRPIFIFYEYFYESLNTNRKKSEPILLLNTWRYFSKFWSSKRKDSESNISNIFCPRYNIYTTWVWKRQHSMLFSIVNIHREI